EDLDGRIDAIVDAGPTEHGVESTVLDPCQTPMIIYRPGAVTSAQIFLVAGAVEIYRDHAPLQDEPKQALPSPGVGLRHYAPHARLVLVEATLDDLRERLAAAAASLLNERIGVMLPNEVAAPAGTAVVFSWGSWNAPEELAQRLYAGMRELDQKNCTVILCPVPSDEGIGAAIRDRLGKAAADKQK